jgi:hypothetical protein
MQHSTHKRIRALATTIPILTLVTIMLTSPSASASAALLPFHHLVNHQMVFSHAIPGDPLTIPTIVVPRNIGIPVNHQVVLNHPTKLPDENANINSHISNTISPVVVLNHVIHDSSSEKDTKVNDNSNHNHNHDNNNNDNHNHDNNNNDNTHNSLDVQDKSFINGIKITDVDRSNPHLLKVTLKRTNDNNGNLPKYVAVVAVGKDDQTVAGSTTLRSDDISNTLTVNVVLKNKNNKNGHLDESADVTVWVVPAALHDISGN